jgi:hypothetical protein
MIMSVWLFHSLFWKVFPLTAVLHPLLTPDFNSIAFQQERVVHRLITSFQQNGYFITESTGLVLYCIEISSHIIRFTAQSAW